MKLKDIMTEDLEVVSAEATVQEVAKKMKDLDVGSLPVVEGNDLVGIITDRDITVRAIAEGRDPRKVKAKEVVTTDVVYGFEDQEVEEATLLMKRKQVRRLVVLNREKQLVGIVSLADLVIDTKDEKLAGQVGDCSG